MTAGGSHTATKRPQSGRMRGGRGLRHSPGQSLPLEGKVVRLKPDRMRSKVTASYQLMVIVDSFDLISQPLRAASFPSRGSLSSKVRGRLHRVKPSPAYRGWHGASRDGCGGDPVRFIMLLGKTIDPTSVTPKGVTPSPQGEGFSSEVRGEKWLPLHAGRHTQKYPQKGAYIYDITGNHHRIR